MSVKSFGPKTFHTDLCARSRNVFSCLAYHDVFRNAHGIKTLFLHLLFFFSFISYPQFCVASPSWLFQTLLRFPVFPVPSPASPLCPSIIPRFKYVNKVSMDFRLVNELPSRSNKMCICDWGEKKKQYQQSVNFGTRRKQSPFDLSTLVGATVLIFNFPISAPATPQKLGMRFLGSSTHKNSVQLRANTETSEYSCVFFSPYPARTSRRSKRFFETVWNRKKEREMTTKVSDKVDRLMK